MGTASGMRKQKRRKSNEAQDEHKEEEEGQDEGRRTRSSGSIVVTTSWSCSAVSPMASIWWTADLSALQKTSSWAGRHCPDCSSPINSSRRRRQKKESWITAQEKTPRWWWWYVMIATLHEWTTLSPLNSAFKWRKGVRKKTLWYHPSKSSKGPKWAWPHVSWSKTCGVKWPHHLSPLKCMETRLIRSSLPPKIPGTFYLQFVFQWN